jgi:Holliday junction resolvase
MKESTLTKRIRDWISEQGGVSVKFPGGIHAAGVPDIIACKNGHTVMIEVKAPESPIRETKKTREQYEGLIREYLDRGATVLQAVTLKNWDDAGATTLVARSLEDVKEAWNNIHIIRYHYDKDAITTSTRWR